MRPRGLSSSSPRRSYVGQVARQKPQCTHLRRIASASIPAGVSRIQSARRVCISGRAYPWSEAVHAIGIENAFGIEGALQAPVDLGDRGLQRMEDAERAIAA